MFELTTCTVVKRNARDCQAPVAEGAAIPLCEEHMMEAFLHVLSRLRQKRDSGALDEAGAWLLGEAACPEVARLKDNREALVYYVRIGDHIKIGTSVSFDSRMSSLQPDEILALEPGGRDVEMARHRQFGRAKDAKGREYFHPTPDLLAHIEELRAINWRPTAPALELPGPLPIRCPSCELLALWGDADGNGDCQSCGARWSAERLLVPTSGES